MNDTSPAARLMDVAIKIADDAPERKGQYVSHALVYWGDMTELRDDRRDGHRMEAQVRWLND